MKGFLKFFLISMSLGLLFGNLNANTLGDLAATMKAGDWRQLTTTGMPAALAASGSSGGIIGYSSSAAWDSKGEKFYYIGSDHCDTRRFVCYDASTNAWSRLPQPPWVNPAGYCNGMGHGYDHQDINVAAGIYYFRENYLVHCYKISTGTWSDTPENTDIYSIALGVSYFPEAHGLFVADMQIQKTWIFLDATSQWKTLSPVVGTSGSYHGISEYNPVHKVVIFGGGNGNRSLYKMDSLQTITRLKDSPVDLNCSSLSSLLTVDPVSGDYLVFTSDGLFHIYNVLTDTWTMGPGSNLFGSTKGGSNGAVWGVIATPISNYGVVMFAKDNLANSMVYIYKHSSGAGIDNQKVNSSAAEGLKVDVSPNPFSSSAAISIASNGHGNVSAGIYNVQGKCVADLSSRFAGDNRIIWDAGSLPAGIYLLHGSDGNGRFSKTLLLRK